MEYGICPISVVPIRLAATDASEMVSQILYGEHFKVLERRKLWSRIRVAFDGFEGWVCNNQIQFIQEEDFELIESSKNPKYVDDLVAFVATNNAILIPIVMGSSVHNTSILQNTFEGSYVDCKKEKSDLIPTAVAYLNTPYLLGGRTPFGLDCAGFTQMVYKINGYPLKRSATAQSTQGEALSFIEESEPGDLAFFDNNEGVIDHVGIIMKDNYIIHANGKIRIDRIDHTGIFNTDIRAYTHSLRVIKKII